MNSRETFLRMIKDTPLNVRETTCQRDGPQEYPLFVISLYVEGGNPQVPTPWHTSIFDGDINAAVELNYRQLIEFHAIKGLELLIKKWHPSPTPTATEG